MQETTIQSNIETGFTHDETNPFQLTRQKTETTALYLQSIFRILGLCSDALQEKPEITDFVDDLAALSRIGKALSGSLLETAMPMLSWEGDFEETRFEEIEPERNDQRINEKPAAEISDLAFTISSVLNNKSLPKPLADSFQEAITDFFNTKIDHTEIEEYEKSGEYISMLLRGYEKRNKNL